MEKELVIYLVQERTDDGGNIFYNNKTFLDEEKAMKYFDDVVVNMMNVNDIGTDEEIEFDPEDMVGLDSYEEYSGDVELLSGCCLTENLSSTAIFKITVKE